MYYSHFGWKAAIVLQLLFMATGASPLYLVSSLESTFEPFRLRVSSSTHLREVIASRIGKDASSITLEVYNGKKGRYEEWVEGGKHEATPPGPSRSILVSLKTTTTSSPQPLMIKGRLFVDSDQTSTNRIVIGEDGEGRASEGTGLVTWDSAVVLSSYFEMNVELVKGKSVIELGAGTGYAALSVGTLGARRVELTDLDYTLDNLRRNVDRNRAVLGQGESESGSVIVRELDWFRSETYHSRQPAIKYDVILCADVVWLESLVPALVKTLAALSTPDQTEIFFAHQSRTKRTDDLLFSLLSTEGFVVTKLPQEQLHVRHRSQTAISVYRIKRN